MRELLPSSMFQPFQPHIFLVEQCDSQPFNRGKLLNVGVVEALQSAEFDYFAFHDIDMLPLSGAVDYSFPPQPRHLATCVQQFQWQMPYPDYFGGVTLVNTVQFIEANGYPNRYWGWGGEDDEFYRRLAMLKLTVQRREPFCRFGIFESLQHEHDEALEDSFRIEKLRFFRTFWHLDGLSSLSYQLLSRQDLDPFISRICVHL
jgi:predicted glycosyltransferase involved in capsule biosynthesis